ncbi:MAG: PHP-associated domain-containing protein [Dehalococcoidia bacterium]
MPSIIDLHVHSTIGSADSEIQPEALVKQAREVGLTGVAITEHVAPWSDEDTRRYCRECGLFLCNAREWETDAGHIITIGLSRELSGITSASKLRDIASAQGAFTILCHPFRDFPGPNNYLFGQMGNADSLAVKQLAEHPIFQMVDAIEILNGGNNERENRLAQEVAKLLAKRSVAGSDAHRTPELGRCAAVFEDDVTSEQDLLAALRSGRLHAAQRQVDGSFVAVSL